MKFKEMTIENFGVYYGRMTIDFRMPPGRNILVVDGNNGWGKTTLQKAIRFCLYGVLKSQSERLDYINDKAKREGNGHMMVQLTFEQSGKNYQVTRTVDTGGNGKPEEDFTVLVNGVVSKAPSSVIDDVLPKDASQFFFFDGEEIKKYTSLENPEATMKAIELVLGIPAIRNAIDHVETIIKSTKKKLDEEEGRDKNAAALSKEVNGYDDEVDRIEKDLKDLEEQKVKLSIWNDKIEKDLHENEAAQESLGKMNKNKSEISHLTEKFEEQTVLRMSELALLPFALLRGRLNDALESRLREKGKYQSRLQDESRLEGAIQFLKSLEPGESCACGTRIGAPEEIFINKQIENYTKRLSSLGKTTDMDLVGLQRLERAMGRIDAIKLQLPEIATRVRGIQGDIDDLAAENKKLEEKLHGIDEREIKELNKKRDSVRDQLTKIVGSIDWNEGLLKNTKVKRAQKQRELDRVSPKTAVSSRLAREIDLTKDVGKALMEYLESTVEDKRGRIQDETSEVHRMLTNKPQVYSSVRINDDYTFSLVDKEGKTVSNEGISPGEKEILALSFIAGLNRSTDKEAPIVMDTPFARLDNVHKTNVLKFLRNLGDQVVILSTDQDINASNIGTIEPYIGKKLEIKYDMKTKTSVISEVR